MKKMVLVVVIIIALLFGFVASVYLPFESVTKGKPIAHYSTPRTALLVIDIQKDMTEKEGKKPLNLGQTDTMIPIVNEVIKMAEHKNWLIVYITHEYRQNSPLRLVTKDFLLEGKPGAAMDSRLLVIGKNHFVKHRMDSFSNVAFDNYLRENQIDNLVISGMAAEECVDRTCQGALNRKYKVVVIGDAIAGSSNDSRIKKIHQYGHYGVDVKLSQSLLNGN